MFKKDFQIPQRIIQNYQRVKEIHPFSFLYTTLEQIRSKKEEKSKSQSSSSSMTFILPSVESKKIFSPLLDSSLERQVKKEDNPTENKRAISQFVIQSTIFK